MYDKCLLFDASISSKKPNTLIDNEQNCPFCPPNTIEEIIEQNDCFIWFKNKFPTNCETTQTLILETRQCNLGIPNYSAEYFTDLLTFAFKCLHKMEASEKYRSVFLFKNHGKLSSGSIRHSHMQIVGLDKLDYLSNLPDEYFQGLHVFEQAQVEINIAKRPMISFTEFNICLNLSHPREVFMHIVPFARSIQEVVRYIHNSYLNEDVSYNLFFYVFENKIVCRALPRYPISAYYVGYKIEQVHTQEKLLDIADELQKSIQRNWTEA